MKPHEVIKENLEKAETQDEANIVKESNLDLLLSVKEMVKAQIPDFETRFNMGYIQAIEKIQLLLDEEINKIKELN